MMRMQKRKFRIGECAKHLEVERFVIRFWEKEFNLKTDRSTGGQRFYSEEDLALFHKIKELLYHKGFTISGAKQQIHDISFINNYSEINSELKVLASKKTDMHYTEQAEQELQEAQKKFEKQRNILLDQLRMLNKQLHKLKQVL